MSKFLQLRFVRTLTLHKMFTWRVIFKMEGECPHEP